MAQTWLGSFVEANSNVAIGFAINWTANITFLPFLWRADSPKLSAFYIGLVFHREHGEVARSKVHAAMFAEAA